MGRIVLVFIDAIEIILKFQHYIFFSALYSGFELVVHVRTGKQVDCAYYCTPVVNSVHFQCMVIDET